MKRKLRFLLTGVMTILQCCAADCAAEQNTLMALVDEGAHSSDLQSNKSALSKEVSQLTVDELRHWDSIVSKISEESPLLDRGKDRLMAYLYNAQKDFLGRLNTTSIGPISMHVIQLFYPNYPTQASSDAKNLTPIVDQRFKEEQDHIHPVMLHIKNGEWKGKIPYHGLEIPSWKPWILKSADEFRLPPPPPSYDSFWNDQLAQVKQIMNQATDSQKERILFWAGMNHSGSGDWIPIVNQYLQESHIPLSTQIRVRDALGRVIVDATIAAFDSKYTYLVKRPDMLDANLKTYIPTPNHPSFPSAHSTVSAAVVEVLNNYFPENRLEWQRLLEEAGMSRIWAGVHFPIDHEAGKKLGKKVGQALLQRDPDTTQEFQFGL